MPTSDLVQVADAARFQRLRPTHALAQSLSKEFRRDVRRGEIRANNELLLDAAFRNPNRNHDLVVCQLIFGRFFKTEDSGE